MATETTPTIRPNAAVLNVDTARSYATEENLYGALARLGFAHCRHVVVCNRSGRFTAIFPASSADSDLGRFAREGFLTVG